jgi:hypothetical protein
MAKSKTTTHYRTPIHIELNGPAAPKHDPSAFKVLPVTDLLRRIHTIENWGSFLMPGEFTSFYETINVYARLGISLASGLGLSEPCATAKSDRRSLEIQTRLDALEECCNASLDGRPTRFDDRFMQMRCNSVFAAKLASEIHAMAMEELGAVPVARQEGKS